MHSYPTHISQQQRIKRLRPDLKAGIAKPVVMDLAAAPVADLLPLRIPNTSEHRRVDVKRIDDKNRLVLSEAAALLGWCVGDPLTIRLQQRHLVIEKGDRATGPRQRAERLRAKSPQPSCTVEKC